MIYGDMDERLHALYDAKTNVAYYTEPSRFGRPQYKRETISQFIKAYEKQYKQTLICLGSDALSDFMPPSYYAAKQELLYRPPSLARDIQCIMDYLKARAQGQNGVYQEYKYLYREFCELWPLVGTTLPTPLLIQQGRYPDWAYT